MSENHVLLMMKDERKLCRYCHRFHSVNGLKTIRNKGENFSFNQGMSFNYSDEIAMCCSDNKQGEESMREVEELERCRLIYRKHFFDLR
jgi:hypothetical protein